MALVDAPAGNQLTSAADELSHVRGVAATYIDPATPLRGSVTSDSGPANCWRRRLVGDSPVETVATGAANCRCSGCPAGTVRKWAWRCALGVMSARRSCSVLPVSQDTALGRLTTT